MMEHWTERLSEYIDGELTETETAQLEAHLMDCADCGRTLQELRSVVVRAGQIIDRPPSNDLWSSILTQIERPADVAPQRPGRRLSFSVPQVAAASVALMLLSGGTVYLMMSRGAAPAPMASAPSVQNAAPVVQSQMEPHTTREVMAMRPMPVESPAADNYNVAIKQMEDALAKSRTSLDTVTVRILETNLRAIDSAINEAQSALARDPGNPYLNRYLDETLQRKIQLLRRATSIIRAQT